MLKINRLQLKGLPRDLKRVMFLRDAGKFLKFSFIKKYKRYLSIHEYQAAFLLKSYGIPVPNGNVASDSSEAVKIFNELSKLA